jgi:uncharacterized protein (DUF58 family)
MAELSSLVEPTRSAWQPIDPAALLRIKNLHLRAKTVVEGFFHGLHRSPYHGFSAEFSEYRPYTPGDDPRWVDWRLFARSDRHYVKRFEDETNLRCYLVVDRSKSMGYGSGGFSKAEYAVTLAASLAYFLLHQHDAVGAMTFSEGLGEFLPARIRSGHLHRLLATLEAPLQGTTTDLVSPLERIAELAPRRGLIMLVSDLLAPLENLQPRLGYLCSQGHEVIVFQTLDPAERDFGFDKAVTLFDMESGREVYVDAQAARAEYLRRFAEHNARLETLCNDLGISLFPCGMDRALEHCLFDFLQARMRRGREVRRRQAAPRSRV